MDKFIEVLLGKNTERIALRMTKSIALLWSGQKEYHQVMMYLSSLLAQYSLLT